MEKWLVNLPSEKAILLHPLAFAGRVGMVITMLNLMPVGMLDGGHISRALFGNKRLGRSSFKPSLYKVVSLIGVGITAILGYWLMAVLMLFFGVMGHPGPVEDTVPLTTGRKVLGIGLFFLLVICATPLTSIILK